MESIVNHIVIRVSTRYVTDLTEIVHMAALMDLEEYLEYDNSQTSRQKDQTNIYYILNNRNSSKPGAQVLVLI